MDNARWQQIKGIFYPALDLPVPERGSFVGEKCAGDEVLKEEIERLLIAHDAAEDFIESPTVAVKNLVSAETISSPVGRTIGAYRIEKEIGRGGMGAVYLAARADAQFEKQVAVKLIKRGLDTDEIIRRFRHERQILAHLDHPNVDISNNASERSINERATCNSSRTASWCSSTSSSARSRCDCCA